MKHTLLGQRLLQLTADFGNIDCSGAECLSHVVKSFSVSTSFFLRLLNQLTQFYNLSDAKFDEITMPVISGREWRLPRIFGNLKSLLRHYIQAYKSILNNRDLVCRQR